MIIEIAHFWPHAPHVIAGVDQGTQVPLHQKYGVKIHQVALPQEDPVAPIVQETHGTWMAMTQSARFAFLTNFREDPKLISPKALSRGLLVRDFVVGQSSPCEYIHLVKEAQDQYNGFNLVVGELHGEAFVFGNRSDEREPIRLQDNVVYGLSNGAFVGSSGTESWQKVSRGKMLFQEAIDASRSRDELHARLMALLQDTHTCSDSELPPNMFNYDLEKRLAPICIDRERSYDGDYGTRSHTIVLVDQDNSVLFSETDRYKVSLNDQGKWDVEQGQFEQVHTFQLS